MSDPKKRLEKKLGLLDIYAVATGATLSAGFFLLPGLAAVEAGPALVAAYVLAAVPLVPGILSKVELMTALPRAGGIYYFLDRSMGPLAGTVGGLGIWLVLMLKVSFALVGMGAYLEIFLPSLPVVPVAVALAVLVGALNLRGTKLTGGVQVALVVGILSILAAFMAFGVPAVEPAHFRGFFDAGPRGLIATAGLVFVSYAGLTKPAAVAEEVEDPERNLSRGVFLAFGTAVLIYAVGTAVIVGVVPMERLQGDLTSVATAGGEIFGEWGVVLLALAAMLAFMAVTNAGTFSASRYPLAMSRDRILPAGFARLNERGLPARAIQVTVAVIVVIIVFLDPMKIAKLASAFKLLVFSMLCLAVVVMRESGIDEYDPGYRTPLYPWTQIVGIVAPWVLIVGMGWLTVAFSLGMILAAGLWYWRYASGSTTREGAIYHIFERLGRRRHEGLEQEFRQILREKGLREEDPYLEMVARARVIDEDGDAELPDVVHRASKALARSVPSSVDDLEETFLEEIELEVTPVAHGAALLHVQLEGLERPELILVRSAPGLFVGARDEAPPEGDGRDGDERPQAVREASDAGSAEAPWVHALFFLVSPRDDPRRHLRMLAKLAGHVSEEGFLARWIGADDEQALKAILLREERALSLTVAEARPTADLAGRTLADTDLAGSGTVVLLRRNGELEEAAPGTVVRPGDRITVLGSPEEIDRLRERYARR